MTMTKYIFFMMVVLCALQSCRPTAVNKESPGINEVQSGAKFRINLAEDHTTGYTWQLKDDFDHDIVERINEVWHGNEKGIDFNLRGRATGQTTLTFISRMYTDTGEIKQFIVKIADY
jgi:predicted secreted protein